MPASLFAKSHEAIMSVTAHFLDLVVENSECPMQIFDLAKTYFLLIKHASLYQAQFTGPHKGRSTRIPFIEACRSILATIVVTYHITVAYSITYFALPAHLSVLAFFFLSGYVLALSWNGSVIRFFVKRLVRLWPLYASCMIVSCLLSRDSLSLSVLLWIPFPGLHEFPPGDPPAWSLYYEVWATPGIIALSAISRRSWLIGALVAIGTLPLFSYDLRLGYVPFFAFGVVFAGMDVRLPKHVPAFLVWLEKISFSLYMTHLPVRLIIEHWLGVRYAVLSLPLIPGVAWLAWVAIEQPSLELSKRVERIDFSSFLKV